MEDDFQILASLRHNGGHLWRITTIYYGFSTSPTSHCTACAEYRSSPTQLSRCQSQKPPDLRLVHKDATILNSFFRKWSQIGGYALKYHSDVFTIHSVSNSIEMEKKILSLNNHLKFDKAMTTKPSKHHLEEILPDFRKILEKF